MACRVWPILFSTALAAGLAGCSGGERQQRPAWREQAEKACIAEHRVHLSRFIAPRGRPIDGPGICGLTEPFMVGALSDDRVQLDNVATLDCPMIAALDEWIARVVQPAAQARFGQPVAQIDTMGSYACRGMNGQAGARISEHAFGNALDIGGFRLADGRRISVVHDWTRGDDQSQAFLRDVHAGACDSFTTVLGPGSNVFHYNHIHVDLAMHGGSSRGLRHICKPVPDQSRPLPPAQDRLPEAPALEEEQDIASSGVPADAGESRGFVASAPRRPAASFASSEDGTPVPGSLYRRSSDERIAHQLPPVDAGDRPSDWDVTSSIPRR